MKNFITKKNFNYRLIQFIILVAHLVLLKWIIYLLHQGGLLPIEYILAHFTGIAVFGALLIRFCAWYFNRQYQKELKSNGTN